MVPINVEDIQDIVSRNALRLAWELQGSACVRKMEVHDGMVTAQVKGSAPTPYRQTIVIGATRSGRPAIHGECSCPVGANCKHVAAVLLELMDQQIAHKPEADDETPAPRPDTAAPLPPEVEAWLRSLQSANVEDPEEYPPSVRKRMLYLLDADQRGTLSVQPVGIELLRQGGISPNVTRYDLYQLLNQLHAPPKFVRPSDRAILRGLRHELHSEEFIPTLRRIIATGRGRWREVDGPALYEADPIPAQLAWRLLDDGRQTPTLDLPPGLLPLRLNEPWYVEPATGRLGPLETALPAALVRAVLAAPALAPDAATRVRDELSRLLPSANVPAPRELAPPQRIAGKTRPRLELFAADLPFDPNNPMRTWGATTTRNVPLARLRFHYGPTLISPSLTTPTVMHQGELLFIVRDRRGETAARETLRTLGLTALVSPSYDQSGVPRDAFTPTMHTGGAAWIEFLMDGIPALRQAGWDIAIGDDFPLRIAEPDGPVTAQLREGSGIDWFDLDLGVMVDGAHVDLVPALLALIEGGELSAFLGAETDDEDAANILLQLEDGRLLSMPTAQLRPILLPLLELFAGGHRRRGRHHPPLPHGRRRTRRA